jgi:membrane associated rhomboid family serine protease
MQANSDMQQAQSQKPLLGADNNTLVALLAINLVVYVMLGLIKTIYYLESLPLEQFYTQIFNPFILSHQWMNTPWALLTYNWVHDGFWMLFANMIWLTLFSYTLQINGANKHLFPIYFYSGLVGAIIYIVSGTSQPLFGAGVSITAIVIAALALIPNYKFLSNIAGGVSLWMVGILYLLLNGYLLKDSSITVIVSTLVGGCTGLLYVLLLKKDIDLGKWMHQFIRSLNNSLAPKK